MIHFDTNVYVRNMEAIVEREFDYRSVGAEGDWNEWQRRFRARLWEATGLAHIDRVNADVPLSPETVERLSFPGYVREKSYVQTEAGIRIPFYLLLPSNGQEPYPLVLAVHGHGRRGKEVYVGHFEDEQERQESLEGERDIALQAVAEGYAAIAMDVRGFWEMARADEVEAKKNNSCAELQKHAMMYGRTLIGERVHDMRRLIAYAGTRPEIDTSRIVITGNSGGGQVSLFTAALDERISVCVPGSFFSTFRGSLLEQSVWHCMCNFVPGMLRLGEMYDVAGLIAPRPLLCVNGERDAIFPIDSAREAIGHVQRIYAAMGAPDRCRLYVGHGGHRYYKEPVWPFVKTSLRLLD
ncbi:alpha/beta hydrolase family protein [Paenibacillus flagellatus]|uniref:Acetylxylan esterase n=1 Tax=Paenibacillus flagellatus TaxID=2211139 RepID=A0A2V5K4X2_9BACL|nr:alpha/beta hydrolase family protein [Paenibacillus flagellatus]PYI54278.1 hypothetical protein DLM86_12425 [Paenibacillus flagellatus]